MAAGRRLRVIIQVVTDQILAACDGVVHAVHAPDEGGLDGVECRTCRVPWPCPQLREYEQQRIDTRGGGDA